MSDSDYHPYCSVQAVYHKISGFESILESPIAGIRGRIQLEILR